MMHILLVIGILGLTWADVALAERCSADVVLRRFIRQVSQIRRPSGDEEAIRNLILAEAIRYGLEYHVDEAGNVLVRVPASPGYETAPWVALQGHMDMVEAVSSVLGKYDWSQGVRVAEETGWMYGLGTSLGADNGLGGVATMLELMSNRQITHGPLELIFTVSEEKDTMAGARQFDLNQLRSQMLINLDYFDANTVCVGCPDYTTVVGLNHIKRAPVSPTWDVHLRLDVFDTRTQSLQSPDVLEASNGAIRRLMKALSRLKQADLSFGLVIVAAGRNAENPYWSSSYPAILSLRVAHQDLHKVQVLLNDDANRFSFVPRVFAPIPVKVLDSRSLDMLLDQWHVIESVQPVPSTLVPGAHDYALNIRNLLVSENVKWAVEVAILDEQKHTAQHHLFLDRMRQADSNLMQHPRHYPPWKPHDSPLARLASDVFRRNNPSWSGHLLTVLDSRYRSEPVVFYPRRPDIQMISIGPTLKNVNTHEEKVYTPSFHLYWKNLLDILEGVAQWR